MTAKHVSTEYGHHECETRGHSTTQYLCESARRRLVRQLQQSRLGNLILREHQMHACTMTCLGPGWTAGHKRETPGAQRCACEAA